MEDIEKMNRMSISSIETFFDSKLRGVLSDNIFFDEMPPVIKESWTEYIIVDCMNVVRDHSSHALGTVLIMMFAKQNPYGTKNVKKMAELESKLNQIIAENDDPHYKISRRGMYSNYNAVNDIFYNVVQISLIIT